VVRLIKRYGSRKLYDTEESRYVSLDELGTWIRDGQELRVVDNKTSADVTAQTLAQVILEESRRGTSMPPSDILHELIRQGGQLVSSGVTHLNQGVQGLIQAGVERLGPVRKIRDETDVLRKRLEELEAALSRLESENGQPAASEETTTENAEKE
jgi:polyhydroxyalkanoate synthesis repressor PhaR